MGVPGNCMCSTYREVELKSVAVRPESHAAPLRSSCQQFVQTSLGCLLAHTSIGAEEHSRVRADEHSEVLDRVVLRFDRLLESKLVIGAAAVNATPVELELEIHT